MLEVSQREDLPVDRIHRVEGPLELELHFSFRRCLRGGGGLAEQLGRQAGGSGFGKRALVQRYVASRVAHLRAR